MSFWLEKKPYFKLKISLFLSFMLISSCARPIGSDHAWNNISNGTMPEYYDTSLTQAVPANNFGERLPSDRFISQNDPGAAFASSSPPGYPQPTEKFLPDNVFQDDGLSNDRAQLASTTYQPSLESKSENFESVENFIDPVEDWLVQEGMTLKQILDDWSDRAGWRLVWKSRRDFKIEAGAMLRGRYVDVTSAVIRNLARATPAPLATFFRGNRVLLIETLEDENAY